MTTLPGPNPQHEASEVTPPESPTGAAPPPVVRRTWATAALALALLAAAGLGAVAARLLTPTEETAVPTDAEGTAYTCSMHPQIRQSGPGSCPLCGMDLTPAGMATPGERRLELMPGAVERAEVETERVQRRRLDAEVVLQGKVDVDERAIATVTARVDGYVERIHVDFVGARVGAGARLLELYSPELAKAQQELLTAQQHAPGAVAPLRERLRRLGLTTAEIERLEAGKQALERVVLHAPAAGTVVERAAFRGGTVRQGEVLYRIADLSRVWVLLGAYEGQLDRVEVGQAMTLDVDSLGLRGLPGRVAFVSPVLDEITRTVDVRVEVENPQGRLRPGMWVRGHLSVPATDGGAEVVAVPPTAVLHLGRRAVAWVRTGPRTYLPRELRLGPRVGAWQVIEAGLEPGDDVVVRGGFLLDSQAQIEGLPSLLSPPEPDSKSKLHAGHGERDR
jgi:Cu(I)/Ag(I) efflux system membrane fusion protein